MRRVRQIVSCEHFIYATDFDVVVVYTGKCKKEVFYEQKR